MTLAITGGRFKGMRLDTPSGKGVTRPTSGKVRQALFNILAGTIEGVDFLDLYAGSGAVGLEALSRGCRSAIMVENHPAAWKCLAGNCLRMTEKGADPATLIRVREEVLDFCDRARREGRRFGVVFADPPFTRGFPDLWEVVEPLVAPEGRGVIQFPSRNPPDFAARANRVYAYGESSLAVFHF